MDSLVAYPVPYCTIPNKMWTLSKTLFIFFTSDFPAQPQDNIRNGEKVCIKNPFGEMPRASSQLLVQSTRCKALRIVSWYPTFRYGA